MKIAITTVYPKWLKMDFFRPVLVASFTLTSTPLTSDSAQPLEGPLCSVSGAFFVP